MEDCIIMKILMIIWLLLAIVFFLFGKIKITTDRYYNPTLIQLIFLKIIFSMIFSLIVTLLIGLPILGIIFLLQ